MELKLSAQETEKILLDWARTAFPEKFNTVHISAQYGSVSYTEFSWETPEPAVETLRAA
jgi:hypothetical protein